MRKKTIFIVGLVILLILGSLYFILGRDKATGWAGVKPVGSGQTRPTHNNDRIQEPVEDTVTIQVINQDKPKDVTFKLYKYKEPIAFEDLDRIEQKTVSFMADYFNAPADETVRQFYNRIIRKYSSPKIQDWEIEGAIERDGDQSQELGKPIYDNYYGPKDMFPVNCERKLLAVYLLPEYYQDEGGFVIPVKIQYLKDGEEKDDVIILGIHSSGDGTEPVLGHLDTFNWVLQEITKKYNLDGAGEK